MPTVDRDALLAMPLEWGGYIIRPTDRKYEDIYEAPPECGIYAWYMRNGDLMYVGRSVSIHHRLHQHRRSTTFWGGDPSLFSYRIVPESVFAAVEVAHIKALTPRENSFMESGSPEVTAMMTPAIESAWAEALPEQEARLDAHYMRLAEQIAARLR